jgi:hypothetical protein
MVDCRNYTTRFNGFNCLICLKYHKELYYETIKHSLAAPIDVQINLIPVNDVDEERKYWFIVHL